MDGNPSRSEPKLLYRRLDTLFGAMDQALPGRELLTRFLADLFRLLQDDLRLAAGVLYEERGESFERVAQFGDPGGPTAESFDAGLRFPALVHRHRTYIFEDPELEASPHRAGILPYAAAAAIQVGERPHRSLFLFVLAPGWAREELDFVLNTVRAALGSRLMEERVRGSFRQAADIQRSLLVDEPPAFPGYDIACRSVAAEEVGGDFYDFMPFDDEILGFAIGDASGHGLPAALLVRDVVTGLRMGIEKDMKVGPAFRKLNQVIHRSRLTSRFVSVFYGELEPNGSIIYVNAGHLPPLLCNPGEVVELRSGGTVIGPLAEARFRRGYARLEPGGTLLLHTDGISERRGASGEQYGVERLTRLVLDRPKDSAETLLERIYAEVVEFGEGAPWEDDATLVVIKREGLPA